MALSQEEIDLRDAALKCFNLHCKDFQNKNGVDAGSISERVNYLLAYGFSLDEISAMVQLLPGILSYTNETVESSLVYFESYGFTKTAVIKMAKRHPAIVGCSAERIKRNLAVLESYTFSKVDSMKLVESFPMVTAYKERRVKESLDFFEAIDFDIRTRPLLFMWAPAVLRGRVVYLLSNDIDLLPALFFDNARFTMRFGLTREDVLKLDPGAEAVQIQH